MKRAGNSTADQAFLEGVGDNVAKIIATKGYKSPYEFWIKKGEGEIAKSTLTYILNGKMDAKLTTYRALARLLNVPLKDILGL